MASRRILEPSKPRTQPASVGGYPGRYLVLPYKWMHGIYSSELGVDESCLHCSDLADCTVNNFPTLKRQPRSATLHSKHSTFKQRHPY